MSQDRIKEDLEKNRSVEEKYNSQNISEKRQFLDISKNQEKVRVIHGANQDYFDIQGKTVGSVKKSLKEVFNIPSEAQAIVSGQNVDNDFVLKAGDSLEFIKEAGVKGN